MIKDVEAAGIDVDGARWLEQACGATLEALDTLGEASATELRRHVEPLGATMVYAPDKAYGGTMSVAPRVLTVLSASGLVVRASNQGGWNVSRPRWARTGQWLGEEPDVPPEADARAELVRRWLWSFGPATVADLKWWLGSTLGAVRPALEAAGAVEVDLHGRTGVARADDLEPVDPVEPGAALLPGLDPTTMGWQEREWYLGPHKTAIFDTAGNAGLTAWWDGRIVGGWNQTASGDVFLQLLEDVGADARAALDAEADRLTTWLGGQRVAPRFPSPLSRQAAG